MDFALLADATARFLAPALPYLLGLGDAAAGEAAKEAGKAGAKKVWAKLRPKVEGKEAALEAAQDLAKEPEEPDAQAAFRFQLKKLLREDPELATEVEGLLRGERVSVRAEQSGSGGQAIGPQAKAVGERGVATESIGGSVHTGDTHVTIVGSGSEANTENLRERYLRYHFERLRRLTLGGVDPALAEDSRARLHLDGVYTALLTRTAAADGMDAPPVGRRPARSGEDRPRLLSALEQLDRHRLLVLLGDPGSGKSTFVNFVGLCLAGEALGREDANLELLREPLPEEEPRRFSEPETEDRSPQPWSHGPLLPVPVVLRDFAARGLPGAGEPVGAETLWKFVASELERAALGDFAEPLKRELEQEGGLVLLDGLDEVPEAHARREQLRAAVEDFSRSFPKCRLLVTSRIYAYQDPAWRLDDFEEATLAAFSSGQIRRFIARWYAEVARQRGWEEDDARGKAARLEHAVFTSSRLRGLAERPLLLTLMASLHAWRGGTLPEERERLYSEAVELLLSSWESQRLHYDSETGEPIVEQPSLSEWLKVDQSKIRGILDELAFEAHASQPDLEGTADLSEDALLGGLTRLSPKQDVNPTRLVDYLRDRAGLLLARGTGVYTFPHRTFQEYLAACHLTSWEFPEKAAELAREAPDRWREAVLLAGAKAARGAPFAAWQLARELSYRDLDHPEATDRDAWGALLAGQLLAESADLGRVTEANREQLDRLKWRLVSVMRSDLPAVERAAAGRALGVLGDPRPEVRTLDGMEFCWVPAGRFWMGSDDHDYEKPLHELDIPYGYWLARYPVTVGQFREYVEASGVEPGDSYSLQGAANLPAVWVRLHEALGFCRWLTERWREALPEGWVVTLPSEAEWEKGARGGDEIPAEPVVRSFNAGGFANPAFELSENPSPQRDYPWEGAFDAKRANTKETELGDRSAVGAFPRGASPCGSEELAGNVWEWTRSLWGENDEATDGREALDAPNSVVRGLRGGSFCRSRGMVRCAVRNLDLTWSRSWDFGFRLVVSPFSLDADPSGL